MGAEDGGALGRAHPRVEDPAALAALRHQRSFVSLVGVELYSYQRPSIISQSLVNASTWHCEISPVDSSSEDSE